MKKEKTRTFEKRVSQSREETYLAKLFALMRLRNNIAFHCGKMHFSDTELRLISEVVSAMYEGKRLISTRLADRLGITRSAVSQIVNRLEKEGVLQRVPDEVDKKIAYVMLAEGVPQTYGKDLEVCYRFIGKVIDRFGEDRFYQMCADFETFIHLIGDTCKKMTIGENA